MAYFLKAAAVDDVYAGDYLAPVDWKKWEAAGPIIGKVSQVLAHPSYAVKPAPYQWRDIIKPIADGMAAFIDALEAADSAWLASFVDLRQHIAGLLPRIRNVYERNI
jgi:hypothetical protein